jgi:NAD+ kinase
MRFGFLLKHGKPEARQIAAELGRLLLARGCTLAALPDDAEALPSATVVSPERMGATVDALVVLGGDGTFLYGASLVGEAGVPIFGVNLGSLGFITPFSRGDAAAALDEACAGRLPIQERVRLAVSMRAPNRSEGQTRYAVNDAVLTQRTQRSIARLLDLEAHLDGSAIANYKADGLIIATPTGSTAYTLAAGGPILTPDVQAMVLTPICPHTLTHRPLVVRPEARLRIRNVSDDPVTLTIDGQWGHELAPGDWIDVRRADRPLRLYQPPTPFFAILRQKLSWGERQG